MIINSLLGSLPITVHTAPDGTPGSRFYLHARNLADAWLYLARQVLERRDLNVAIHDNHLHETLRYSEGGRRPPRFHIVGEREVSNSGLVLQVADLMGVEPRIEPVSFHQSRPGHDLRYALDGRKIAVLGWEAPVGFEESLERTVKWTLEHAEEWL